jgi:glutamate racemase
MSASDSLSNPIGVYDSGIGGLSVLRALQDLLTGEDWVYFGDQARVPYGNRSLEEIRQLADGVTQFFLNRKVKAMVIACNTASAAALKYLRGRYPELPIIGMEPAVKPAAEQTRSGHVGVLATPSTFQGDLYASVVERFAQDVVIHQATCPGLVAQIENGHLKTPKTLRILREAIEPMLAEGVDTLVMGCTHFPFVIPAITQISAGRARVIDPAPAIARQVRRVLEKNDQLSPRTSAGQTTYFTSGDALRMQRQIQQLLGIQTPARALRWHAEALEVE